ncbi:hypothetical protein TKK_0002904 [Trichogramma kaykai]
MRIIEEPEEPQQDKLKEIIDVAHLLQEQQAIALESLKYTVKEGTSNHHDTAKVLAIPQNTPPLHSTISSSHVQAPFSFSSVQTLTQSSSTPEFRTPSHTYKILHTVHFPQHHIDWHAINDVVIYSEYTPSKLMLSVTSKFGFAKSTGYRLLRGCKEPASMDNKQDDIDHLVFVVHGIGQKRDTGKIIHNTSK